MEQTDHANDITQRFEINPGHSITVQNQQANSNSIHHCETCWYLEKDASNTTIARYRTWTTTALLPPYRKQIGWERYTVDGRLLSREVRYSKQDQPSQLH